MIGSKTAGLHGGKKNAARMERRQKERVERAVALECEQVVAGMFDRTGDRALVLRGEASVFAGEDLARIGHVAHHCLGSHEGNLRRSEAALGLFRCAHGKRSGTQPPEVGAVNGVILGWVHPCGESSMKPDGIIAFRAVAGEWRRYLAEGHVRMRLRLCAQGGL